VREYIASGDLLPDDLAWHEGAAEWLPLQQVIESAEAMDVSTPEAEPIPEPMIAPEPEPAPVAARSAEPSWIPPRRDGSSSMSFAQPARIPLQGAFAPTQRPAPVRSSSVVSVASPRSAPMATPAPASPAPSSQARARAVRQPKFHPYRAAAIRDIIGGGLFFFGGTAVTVVTFEDAMSRHGGGTYVFTWGAILFGGIQLVRGLILFFK
jgi:hypothetical protein